MNIITLDFSKLCAEEKQELIYTLDKSLQETTVGFSFIQKILVQTLFAARSYHFYEQIFERLSIPMPALYQDVMEHIWLYLLGDIDKHSLEKFYQSADSVFICLLTGDDEFLDEESWDKYEEEWDTVCCGFFLPDAVAPDYILEQIVSEKITWYELPDNQLMCSIKEYIVDCSLEPISDCGHKYDDAEAYGSATFAEIFSLLQQDLCLVKELKQPTRQDIIRLQKEYQNKGLFHQEQVIKIADNLKDFYHL